MGKEQYPILFSPMKIGNVEIKNRVVQTSMGVDQFTPDGFVTDRAIRYYTERAENGVGLIFTEYTRLNEGDGVSSVGQPSLATDAHIEGMKRLIDSVHGAGAKMFVQLQHPGRQTVPLFPTFWPLVEKAGRIPGFWDKYNDVVRKATAGGMQGGDERLLRYVMMPMKGNLAPSKLPADPTINMWYIKHKEMSKEDIRRIEQEFIDGAVRAQKAGADGVEIHATHGYLLQQFLSPFTNRRDDEYGGSLENRARIVKEIIEGIKNACGQDYPVSVRLTVDEFEDKIGHAERGYKLPQGVEIAKLCEQYGADAINVSIGATDTIFLYEESMRYPVGWRKYMAKAVKDAVSIPVIAVGVIRTPEQAEEQLAEGDQDFIGLARSLLADPEWAKKAAEGRSKEISRCIGCMRCMESTDENMMITDPPECSLNPRLCKEIDYPAAAPKDGNGREVVIVGAGPSGLMAARELARRGFAVTVYEKASNPGGQLDLASRPPMKERILWTTEDYLVQAEAAGATVVFNHEVTAEELKEKKPYATILATGGFAVHPRIPGADADYVCTVTPVLLGKVRPKNKSVAVIGSGMTGLETAELLTEDGNTVTVVEMADKIAPGAGTVSTQEILPELNNRNVTFLPGHKLEKIENHHIFLSDKRGSEKQIAADVVVLSLGVRPENTLYETLKDSVPNLYTIGDADKPGRIVHATQAGFTLGRTLK